MMKKQLLFFLFMLLPMIASALTVEIDGIYYNLNSTTKEAEVTKNNNFNHGGYYSGNIIIPEFVFYDGAKYMVTSIGGGAFCDSFDLTSISIPNSVTVIKDGAFDQCLSLFSVIIPNSVTTIEREVFHHCYKLESVTLGNSIKYIGLDAFRDCFKLTDVYCYAEPVPRTNHTFDASISEKTTLYVPEAFIEGYKKNSPWNSFKNIVSMKDNNDYCKMIVNVNNTHGTVTYNGTKLSNCSRTFEVNAGSDVILTLTPDDGYQLSVVVNGVDKTEEVNEGQLTIKNVESNLEISVVFSLLGSGEVQFDDGDFYVEIDGISYNLNSYKKVAVVTLNPNGNTGNVVIPETVTYNKIVHIVTTIGGIAFSGSSGLTSISIPNTVTYIGNAAFEGCSSLTSINIPDGVTYIGEGAFHHCKSLTSIKIPDGVTSIYDWTFWGCSGLSSINIPRGLKSIGESAFSDCSSLTSIYIPDGVTSIAKDAFKNCSSLTSIKIPNSVTSIGGAAFFGCSGLTSITIPNSVTSIGSSAFSGCSGLTSVTIPNSVTSIEIGAFWGCSGLTSITIPNSVTSIGGGAFEYCFGLTSITIPNSVTSIGQNAFSYCSELKDVYCYAETVPTTNSNAFDNSNIKNATLYVPKASFEAYKTSEPWKNFKKIAKIGISEYTLTYLVDNEVYKTYVIEEEEAITPEPIPTKEGYTFSGWSEIPQTMPNHDVTVTGTFNINKYTLTYKVDGAEYKTYELEYNTEITPEENPKRKGMTFSGWSEIPSTMPAEDVIVTGSFSWSKETIENVIYEVADTIKNNAVLIGNDNANGEVKIYDSVGIDGYEYKVTTIEDKAFFGCSNITTVDIPATVTTIGERAFANIDKLTDVTVRAEELPTIDRTAFENSYIEDYVTLHVPGSALKKYQETAPWKNFKEIVAIPGTEVIETYKLIYMVDGEEYKTFEVKEGDAITPEPAPTKEGYTFSGWSEIPNTMPAEDVTVTGTFTINKYVLTYLVDGEVYKSFEVEYGSAITPEPSPEREGYTFSGWSEIPKTMPAKDITITGTFTKGQYKLTYMVDGQVYKTISYDYNDAITPEDEPTKEGYTFSGWSTIPQTMPAKDVTVTGTFTINKYKLTYTVDGTEYKTYEVEYGATITPEDEPTKEGYTFSGWSEIPQTMPAEDVIIIGTFTKAEQVITENGITITIKTDGTVVLSGCDNASGDYTIPETIIYNGEVIRIDEIGENAFRGNNAITKLVIPNVIKTIRQYAFEGCENLRNIILGRGLTSIGAKAFANIWKGLKAGRRAEGEGLHVECNATSVPETALDAFEGTDLSNATLLVDDALVNEYKATAPWSQFGTIKGFNEATGITIPLSANQSQGARVFSLDGKQQNALQKGLNIVRMSDGRTKKVVVK